MASGSLKVCELRRSLAELSSISLIVLTGCRTCRRRKIKCDERHPECMRCEKTGVACEGFALRNRFVDEGPRLARHPKNSTNVDSCTISDSSTTCQTASILSNFTSESLSLLPDGSRVVCSDRGIIPLASKFQTPKWDCNIERGLTTILNENTQIAFLLTHLFSGLPASRRPYLVHVQASESSIASALPGIQALAAAYFGRRHRSQKIIHDGSKFYGQALKALNSDLTSSVEDRPWSVAVLRSACVLALYEVCANHFHSKILKLEKSADRDFSSSRSTHHQVG